MKTVLTWARVTASAAASSGATSVLHPLEPIDSQSIACGCEFNAAEPGQPFYSGPKLLVLAPNGNSPNARVNVGKGNLLLKPAQPLEFPLYECTAGKVWSSRWVSEEVDIQAELRALRTGEESCWFEGIVAATSGGRSEVITINGACGC